MQRRVLVLAVALALFLRLLPTVATGLPFSTDSWPLIRDAEVLLRDPSVRVLDSDRLDGYNNRWPHSILLGTVAALVLGVPPCDTMRVLVPALNALFVVAVSLIIVRHGVDRSAAYLSAVALAAAPTIVVFTAGVTKETLAHVLMYTLLLAALSARGRARVSVVVLVSLALVLCHHLTSLVTACVLASIVAMRAFCWFLGRGRPPLSGEVAALAAVVGAGLAHYVLVGSKGLWVSFSELEVLASYYVAFAAVPLVMESAGQKPDFEGLGRPVRALVAALVACLVVGSLSLSTDREMLPGIRPLSPGDALAYGAFFLAPALLVAAHKGPLNLDVWRYFLGPWLASALSLAACSVFANSPFLAAVFHRFVNFVVIGLATYFGVAASEADGVPGRVLVAAALVLAVASGVLVQARVMAGLDRASFYWLYRKGEVVGFARAASFLGSLAGDSKVAYFLELTGTRVDVAAAVGLAVKGLKPHEYLVLYADNLEKGVVTSLNVIPLCAKAREALSSMSVHYSNGYVYVYGV